MKFRFLFLIGSTTLTFLFAIFHVYNLQIIEGDRYVTSARAFDAADELLTPRRGAIYFTDKEGDRVPAAITKVYENVFASPMQIKDPELVAGQLTAVFPELEKDELIARLSNPEDEYEVIAKRISKEQGIILKEAGIQGVHFEYEKARYYPLAEVGAQVVGFVGKTDDTAIPHGKYGIELYYDSILAGTPGKIADGKMTSPVAGKDVVLTLDREVQVQAETILRRLVHDYRGVRGSIVVQEPKSGKIVALANYPTFDPNSYADAPLESFTNPVVEHVYEPGSVFKLITMAAAIDSEAVTPETTYVDTGSITMNGMTVRNWDLKAHGLLTMSNVIEQSINTGTIFAERKTGHNVFYDYLLKFGLKEPTNISLPGEVVGKLTPLEYEPQDINFATASYGQGISLTPLRLITSISAIANGGVMRRPFIVASEQTNEDWDVISRDSARQITDMMVSTVKKNVIADIPHYRVAGKTGTAFIPENGKYSDQVINTFVGFAPAEKPRFTVLVKLERPEGAPLAGQTVVPAFREMTEFLLNYYHVPPSDL